MSAAIDLNVINGIVDAHNSKPEAVIAILQDIQEKFRYIPREAFSILAKKTGISEATIYGTATFYENFSLEPKGEYVVKICDGTACHVRKSIPVLDRFRLEFGLSEEKHTTDDLGFTVETVSCLGACGLAPVLTINEKVYPAMTPEKASAVIKELKEEWKNASKK